MNQTYICLILYEIEDHAGEQVFYDIVDVVWLNYCHTVKFILVLLLLLVIY